MLAQPEGLGVTLIHLFGRLTGLGFVKQVGAAPAARTGQGRGTDRQ